MLIFPRPPTATSNTLTPNPCQLVSNKGKFKNLCFRDGLLFACLLALIIVQDKSHFSYLTLGVPESDALRTKLNPLFFGFVISAFVWSITAKGLLKSTGLYLLDSEVNYNNYSRYLCEKMPGITTLFPKVSSQCFYNLIVVTSQKSSNQRKEAKQYNAVIIQLKVLLYVLLTQCKMKNLT